MKCVCSDVGIGRRLKQINIFRMFWVLVKFNRIGGSTDR